jgi:cytochrome oxidase Cu insertion factor (SCO1/SenC/PrrC family)
VKLAKRLDQFWSRFAKKVTNNKMAKVELNMPAPDFTLKDYRGNSLTLSDFQGEKIVLLVFNRGFT